MKNNTLALLCFCSLLTACDTPNDAVSKTEPGTPEQSGYQASYTATDTGAGLKDAAVRDTATAVDSVEQMEKAASEKTGDIIASVSSDEDGQGESVYKSKCFACHGAGVAGAPKLGDKSAWDERIAQGNEVLSRRAIEGFKGKTGYMPPKGGYMNLSDDEVTLAVKYMVSQVP